MHPNSGKLLPVMNLCPVLLHGLLYALSTKFCFFIWCWELFSLTLVGTQMIDTATTYKRFLVLCSQAPAGLEDLGNFQTSPNCLKALELESPRRAKSVPVWFFWSVSARQNNNSCLWYASIAVSMLLDPQSCCQLCLCWPLQKPEGFTLQRCLAWLWELLEQSAHTRLCLLQPAASMLAHARQNTLAPCRAASPRRVARLPGLAAPWLSLRLCFVLLRASSCFPWSSTHPWNTTIPTSTHPGATC